MANAGAATALVESHDSTGNYFYDLGRITSLGFWFPSTCTVFKFLSSRTKCGALAVH